MVFSRKISRWSLVLLMALGLALDGTAGCKKKAPPPPPPPPTPTPVPPPGSLVFVQRGHLVRLDLASSSLTPLTGGTSTEWFPACSPKGGQVAYWSNVGSTIYNLWKINLDGSDRVQLTFDSADSLGPSLQNLLMNDAPCWSADGKHIVYSQQGDLWEMDSDGYNPETLLPGHEAYCPALSPDGKTLLFVSEKGDTVYNLWSMDLSDLSVKKLTSYTDWNVGSPSFSEDGRKILFNLYRGNSTQVYVMDADGTQPANLTNDNHSLCPRYAQNGRSLVYCSYTGGENVDLNLFMAGATGLNARQVTTDGGSSPTWAPSPVKAEPSSSEHSAGPSIPAISLPTPVGK